jgi:hypothetical protein
MERVDLQSKKITRGQEVEEYLESIMALSLRRVGDPAGKRGDIDNFAVTERFWKCPTEE